MLTSTSAGATREAMDEAFAGPDPPLGALPDGADPPMGTWPDPPDGAPPKPLPGRKGAVLPVKPLPPAALELPMASPMNPPRVPATSKAATPPATASARCLPRLPHGFSPPGPGHPAGPPGDPGGGPYVQ